MRGNKLLHILDRYVLPLCLYILSLVWRKKKFTKSPRKIGILKLVAIGDLTLATSLLLDMRKTYPDAELHLYLGEDNSALADMLPVHDLHVRVLSIGNLLGNIFKLRKEHFDLFIDLGDWTRYEALLSGLSGAKRILGFETPGQNRHYLYSDCVIHDAALHQLGNIQNLARLAGGKGDQATALSCPDLKDVPVAVDLEQPVVLLHPWPSGIYRELKEWPHDHWARLSQNLIKQGYQVYVSAAPNDRDRQNRLFEEFELYKIHVHDLCGKLTLAQLVWLFCKHPNLKLVSVNTGIMHMAATCGVRTIALNGPTNPKRWGAVGPKVTNIAPPGHIKSGYLNLGFEYPEDKTPIMQHIAVSSVLRALED